jgi:predicted enzyme related to lactoylglutathione lyase
VEGMDATALRTKYRPGVPCWVDTSQPDVDAAIAFYGGVFAWDFEERPVPAPDRYLVIRGDGEVVGGLGHAAAEDPERARWTTYVTVANADDAADRTRAHGGEVRFGPVDAGPAGRSAIIVDPQGAEVGLWQQGKRLGAEHVNQPGGWVFSDLVTPDPGAARPFYEAMFGWEARPIELGGAAATMWCVPGYGDALAEIDPTIRERHAEVHAPEGFTDAVGWLEQADGPAHWRVTPGVDDPDGTAERVAKLGGEVLVAPHDVGPVRMATVADPAGAPFVISRYQP